MKTTPLDGFLADIQQHEAFPALVEKLTKGRPIVPSYDCSVDNTERWKSISGQKDGFDLCLSLLKIKLEN